MSIAEKLTQIADNMPKVYNAGVEAGKAQGGGEETLFTDNGVMYKRNMVVEVRPLYGFGNNAYMYAHEMLTFSAPEADVGNGISSSVLRFCEKLKTVYLPKIRRIGNTFFGNCTALEEVTLGCEEVPMVQIQPNSFLGCSALVWLNLVGAITTSFSLQWSPLLDDASVQNIVDSLADLTGQTSQTLTVSTTTGNRIAELGLESVISAKNWVLAIV